MKTTQPILKAFVLLLCLLAVKTGFAQNVGISSTSSFTPDASAGLDVSYTSKGLLIPRVALTATNAAGPITSPATSLLVYNTATAGTAPNNVVPGYFYWNGTAWVMLTTSTQTANFWSTTGNAGTSYLTNFLGTTDNQSLRFRTNNAQRFWLDSLGNAAVGLAPFFNASNPEKLLVDAGTTSSFNVISGKGNINNYLQLNIQNSNAGTAASSDVVATADNGNETVNYVDMGINSSANTAAFFGAANDAYLYNAGGTVGGNFFIGTSTTGKSLGFLTGGGATTNERMRIDGSGNVGIGNIAPTQKLDITGNLKFSGALMPNNNAGTTGYFLQSAGAGAPPVWFNAGNLVTSQAWGLLGNAGTTAGTNFIGTTDAVDMVFKANNVERMRIVNGTSSTTGTTGDIIIGDANSGTIRSTKELVLRQDGDAVGQSTLRLRNRSGQNGAVFETTGSSANLVDLVFNTGPVATPISSNIRFETRSANIKVAGNTTEWQIGQPDVNNGGPTLVVGASGTASSSAFLTGKVGIGTNSPATKLHVFGANPLTLSGVVTGTSTSADSLLTITSGLVRKLPMATFASPTNSWAITGNAGTTAGTNFIGTTDAVDFVVKTNNTENTRFASTGDVSIGGTAFNSTNPEQLLVDAGTTTSFNVISGKGNINNYLQLNIQNNNAGTAASSDVVATADNGNETVNYVDMGINSSANTAAFFGAANDAYLYNAGGTVGGNFFIGTSSSGKSLAFLTGGGATTNERMRILGTGQVGIGTTTPASDLTLFQSSGTSKGFRFIGNSIGGVNSGTGFLFALGYNSTGNKQIWFGDPDAAGNSTGTFLRIAAGTSNLPTIDAVAGDNSNRRFVALGTGGDPNGGVMFGNDGIGSTSPGSFVWDNGNMAIGSGYKANAAPTNGLIVQGNVGIGTASPNSTLTNAGSLAVAYRSVSGAITISATDYVLINTGAAATWTLPAASASPGRVYKLVNHGTGAITLSVAVYTANASTTTTLAITAGSNALEIMSDGTNWRVIR